MRRKRGGKKGVKRPPTVLESRTSAQRERLIGIFYKTSFFGNL